MTQGQYEVRQAGPSDRQPSATQYKYLDAVRALGGTAGQRISRPKIHRPLADGLFDSESSEEDPHLQAGRLQVATHRLSYNSLTQPDVLTHEETRDMTQTLPHTRNVLGVTIYYTGHPTTRRWYTDGSKRHGRAGGGINNGECRAAFRVHGPQWLHRAESMACAVALDLAQPGDEIVLDNHGVVKATPVPRRGVVKDEDYRDESHHNVTTKNLTTIGGDLTGLISVKDPSC